MKTYPGKLLWRMNDDAPLIALKQGNSIDIYSSKMEFTKSIRATFEPDRYLVVSENRLLVFDMLSNKNGLINVETGEFIENKSPVGTSINKPLSDSVIFPTTDGFVFFPRDTSCRAKTYLYSTKENRFRKFEMDLSAELPHECFAAGGGINGYLFCKDEEGNFQACSLKTGYEKKKFVPEMKISKELLSDYAYESDAHSLACAVSYVSIKKRVVILASSDKSDISNLLKSLKSLPKEERLAKADSLLKIAFERTMTLNTGRIGLFKDGKLFKEIRTNDIPITKSFAPFSDEVVFIYCAGHIDAYSTDDLALLASFPMYFGRVTIFLPDGRMVYEIGGDVHVSDSSPLTVALKALEKKKQY